MNARLIDLMECMLMVLLSRMIVVDIVENVSGVCWEV